MPDSRFTIAATVLFVSLIGLACQNQAPAPRPNIIFILADDLGYGEVGAYGQQLIRTPNIDQLAETGIRFTQHYSGSPVCAPSRGTLLTGKHTGHAYIRDNKEMGGWGPDEPEGQLPLPETEFTVTDLLKNAGYNTAVVGKWGLGGPDSEGLPSNHGVDLFYGYLCQRVAHNYYPTHLWRNNTRDTLEGNAWFSAHQRIDQPLESMADYESRFQGAVYAPDRMIDESINFIRDNADHPFFLLYASPIPHVALQVPQTSLQQYEGQFPETPYLGEKSYLPHPEPRAAYAAMISRLDDEVGRIMQTLDDVGISENTLVIFSSDNGPTYAGGADAEFFDSAGGLRGLKGSVFEGGIRVPMIARWPGHISPGTLSGHPSAFWDFMPTVADITGEQVPEGIDGVSYLPSLVGNSGQAEHDYLYWEYHAFGGMQAVRMGNWKAVRLQIREQQDSPIELYDLVLDKSESMNVAADHPEVVRQAREYMNRRSPSPIDEWNFRPRNPIAGDNTLPPSSAARSK
ncbi:MAG: arylsulfatase [Bacteroidetes bacterium]|nr:arylsulfatase [Bacteroidota bacterium]